MNTSDGMSPAAQKPSAGLFPITTLSPQLNYSFREHLGCQQCADITNNRAMTILTLQTQLLVPICIQLC